MIATAAGLTAPNATSTPLSRNTIHGIAATCPPTARMASWTSQSTVPLPLAMANRNVTPTRMTNSSAGKPARMSSVSRANTPTPTPNAATRASAPRLTERTVPTRKTSASTTMVIS